MIGRLLTAIRAARIAHHHRVAQAAGATVLAAQQRRDWFTAASALRDMHAAQARRDALLGKQPRRGCVRCTDCFPSTT